MSSPASDPQAWTSEAFCEQLIYSERVAVVPGACLRRLRRGLCTRLLLLLHQAHYRGAQTHRSISEGASRMSLENRVCINSCEEYDSRRIYAVIQEQFRQLNAAELVKPGMESGHQTEPCLEIKTGGRRSHSPACRCRSGQLFAGAGRGGSGGGKPGRPVHPWGPDGPVTTRADTPMRRRAMALP